MTQTSEITSLVNQLDQLVPEEGAWVCLTQYGGGPEESQVTANLTGYQRFGIEFLKATISAADSDSLCVDISKLLSPCSRVRFDWFTLSEIPPELPKAQGKLGVLITTVTILIAVLIFILAIIGLCVVIVHAA